MLSVVLLLSFSLVIRPCLAQGSGFVRGRYFPATGHNVQGDFWDYFQAHGGEALFSDPLTEEFIIGQATVQFFERAVIERPLGAPASAIRLQPIAIKMGKTEPPLPQSVIPRPNDAERRYFPATGHSVCRAFLEFFEAHGGASFFGHPIGEIRVEEGVIVQYFQNVSLEWHPAGGSGHYIRLGPLGQRYLQALDLPSSLLRPAEPLTASGPAPTPVYTLVPVATASPTATQMPTLPPTAPPPSPTKPAAQNPPKLPLLPAAARDLQLEAAVKYPTTGQGGYQTVYVKVRDRQGKRVEQARVDLIVRSNAGAPRALTTNTDASGRASFTFDIGSTLPGNQVLIDVRASRGGTKGYTQTSFTPGR